MSTIEPIKATADLLTQISTSDLKFDASSLVIYSKVVPTETSKQALKRLVCEAQKLAFAASYSSLLVGGSNESTDLGDVAIWLGDGEFGIGNEMNTLAALGMEAHADKIRASPSEPATQLEAISQNLLQTPYSFSVVLESYIFCFYIGRLKDGWGGLAAVGVWT